MYTFSMSRYRPAVPPRQRAIAREGASTYVAPARSARVRSLHLSIYVRIGTYYGAVSLHMSSALTHPYLRALPKETRYIHRRAALVCVAVNVQPLHTYGMMYVHIYRITPITKSESNFQKCKSCTAFCRYLAKVGT